MIIASLIGDAHPDFWSPSIIRGQNRPSEVTTMTHIHFVDWTFPHVLSRVILFCVYNLEMPGFGQCESIV
jgi:hypothetical protein